MSRSINNIQSTILNAIASDPVLSQLNSISEYAIYRLWSYIIATSIATEEQLNDQYRNDVENLQNKLAPATRPWIQAQAFKFQYSVTNPQVINLDTSTFTPYYPGGVVSAYQIITNCSVTQGNLNSVNIKVAKGYTTTTPPQALTTNELQAFQYYMNQIKPAGIIYNCFSGNADLIKFAVTVTYYGVYGGVIANNLYTAYKAFIEAIPFDGTFVLVDLLIALRQVAGVANIVVNECIIRAATLPFGSGTTLVTGNDWLASEYSTISGYMKDETTAGNTFLDLLTLQSI